MRGTAQAGQSAILNNPNSFFAGPSQMPIGDQAAQFFNPYQKNVIDATRGEFDHLRSDALRGTNGESTLAGAFGGTRGAALAGARLGALDRSQASTIAGLQQQGYGQALTQGLGYQEYLRSLQERQLQEPIFRYNQALSLGNQGMGPYGTSQSSTQPRNWMGGALGGAEAGSAFGPIGAGVGGVIGGLFGG